jgi:transcriptional regulator with XRE-family HTH domain
MITPEQCRAARKLLGWSIAQLATAAGLGIHGVVTFEATNSQSRHATRIKLRDALESAGIEFLAEDAGGPGVRLRTPAAGPAS